MITLTLFAMTIAVVGTFGLATLVWLTTTAVIHAGPPFVTDDPEPVAQQKRIWSSLSCQRDGRFCQAEEEVFSWMAGDVGLRRRRRQKTLPRQ